MNSLHEDLHYCEESGLFTWLRSNNQVKRGDIAGNVTKDGYIRLMYKGKKYLAHRLAWYYVYGYFPTQIDHINRVKTDNRLSNLREVTNSENQLGTFNTKEEAVSIRKHHETIRSPSK